MKKFLLMMSAYICFASVAFAQSVVFRQSEIDAMQPQQPAPQIAQASAPVPQEPKRPKPVKLFGGKYKIVALVNGDIISSNDLQSSVNMFVVNTGILYNAKTKDMIMQRVMQSLIDEKLKIVEARKNGITIPEKEIQASLAAFAKSNKIPLEKLEQVLALDGVNISSLKTKIEADAAWQKLISKKAGAYAQVTPAEIKQEKKDIEQDLQKSRYMISEIVIPVKNARSIEDLVAVLREDPRFELYAMQFSESASAGRGGNLGWVNKETLNEKLVKQLEKMKDGAVSDAVRIGDKYYIIKLMAKYNPQKDNAKVPSDQEVGKYLQNKKTDEYVNRLMQDIRNRAIIEIRG